ncbi:replication fork protection component Swi3-domain-containing protein [Aspergillus californicus]
MANEATTAVDGTSSSNYVDDLFDYDVGLDEILQNTNTNKSSTKLTKPVPPPDNSGVILGLDEEVKVAKKKQSVAKLDESRLLSQAGIPKLRRSAKNNLKFKGKGHEFSDLARLLNFYQLWLDDLFPKAKFADGLAMIERLGHSKRVQTMRRTWIDEEKPKSADDDTSDLPLLGPSNNGATNSEMIDAQNSTYGTKSASVAAVDKTREQLRNDMDKYLFMSDNDDLQRTTDNGGATLDDDDLDELDALLREHENEPGVGKPNTTGIERNLLDDDDMDELDMLLREHEDDTGAGYRVSAGTKHNPMQDESHADEIEAMERLDMSNERPS